MLMSVLIFIGWIMLVSGFIVVGFITTSALLFLIGLCLLFVPLFIGEVHNTFTPEGKKQAQRDKEIQLEIEKEFGIIEYKDKK